VLYKPGCTGRAAPAVASARARIALFLAVVLSVAALLVVAGVVVLFALGRDEPAPNVADLKVVRRDLSDDANAFEHFQGAAKEMYWPDEREDDTERLGKMLGGEPEWDRELAVEFLEVNERMFEMLDKGLALEACQVAHIECIQARLGMEDGSCRRCQDNPHCR